MEYTFFLSSDSKRSSGIKAASSEAVFREEVRISVSTALDGESTRNLRLRYRIAARRVDQPCTSWNQAITWIAFRNIVA
jgi:hypothetical protein